MVNRLPVKFEEVLKKHYIFWICDEMGYGRLDWGEPTPKHELAGIALEDMGGVSMWLCKDELWKILDRYGVEDKDFCECIFKAVREIYG
jgi:hypothetical protein